MTLANPVRRFTAAAVGAAMVASLCLASASGIPKPKSWFSLDNTFDGGVSVTTTLGPNVFAGGWFSEVNGEPAEGFAQYDGTTWSAIPSGPGFEADSLTTWDESLIAGGAYYYFDETDNSPGGVASWDGDTWTDLTGNLPEGTDVSSLVVADGDLYAFGFTYVDPQNPGLRTCLADKLVSVSPPTWESIGELTASDCMVNDAVVSRSGDSIYVVGDFTDVTTGPSSGFTANGVARYDLGDTWHGYGDGVDFGEGAGSPLAVVEGFTDGDLVVAGAMADGTGPVAMATWNPVDEWVPIDGFTGDDGVDGRELAWGVDGLYLGGYFDAVDDVTMNGITRWDGMAFHAVGDGVTYGDGAYAAADTITPYDNLLFVFGDFEKAGSVSAAGVAYYGPAVAPGAPRAVKATAGKGVAAVTWSAPLTDGGSAVTRYIVSAAPGSRTCVATAPTRTCTVTGLTAGTAYRFTVKATNVVGTGPASAASAAVTALGAASARYVTITTRVLFFAGDARVGPKGAAALAAVKARVPAGAKVTWVKVTGYVQGTTSRYVASDTALALARAKASAGWLTKHGVGGAYTVVSGGVSGSTGLARSAVVAIRYVVPAA
jgi:hypothetical protein